MKHELNWRTGTAAGAGLARDVYYGGSRTKWNALNTLELKLQMNLAPDSVQCGGCQCPDQCFAQWCHRHYWRRWWIRELPYKYGTATVPNSGTPVQSILSADQGRCGRLSANYFMHEAFGIWDPAFPTDVTKVVPGPPVEYYFYRRVGASPDVRSRPQSGRLCAGSCSQSLHRCKYCVLHFWSGFYGRDHGDASGTKVDR